MKFHKLGKAFFHDEMGFAIFLHTVLGWNGEVFDTGLIAHRAPHVYWKEMVDLWIEHASGLYPSLADKLQIKLDLQILDSYLQKFEFS